MPVPPENSVSVDCTALTFRVHGSLIVYRAPVDSTVARSTPDVTGTVRTPAVPWAAGILDRDRSQGVRFVKGCCPQIAVKTHHETVRNRAGTARQRDDGVLCRLPT